MKDENKKSYLPTKRSLIIRIAVGLYLFYTAYSLREAPAQQSGGEKIVFIVFILIFTLLAIFLCVHSVRSFMTGKYEGGALDNSMKEEIEEVEEDTSLTQEIEEVKEETSQTKEEKENLSDESEPKQ